MKIYAFNILFILYKLNKHFLNIYLNIYKLLFNNIECYINISNKYILNSLLIIIKTIKMV